MAKRTRKLTDTDKLRLLLSAALLSTGRTSCHFTNAELESISGGTVLFAQDPEGVTVTVRPPKQPLVVRVPADSRFN